MGKVGSGKAETMRARAWFYGPTGFGSTRGNVPDLSRAVPNETYQCRDCYHTGPLNIRGGCEICGSLSVQSTALFDGEAAQLVVLSDADHIRTSESAAANGATLNGTGNPVDVGPSPTFSTTQSD